MKIPVSAKLLKSLRKEKGWSIGYLVWKSGVSKSTIDRIGRAKDTHLTACAQAERLAEAFGIEVTDLCDAETKIIVADGEFKTVNFEFFDVSSVDGEIKVRHVGTNLANPRPGLKITARFDAPKDTLIIRSDED